MRLMSHMQLMIFIAMTIPKVTRGGPSIFWASTSVFLIERPSFAAQAGCIALTSRILNARDPVVAGTVASFLSRPLSGPSGARNSSLHSIPFLS